MAQKRPYRFDLQRPWTAQPLQPGTLAQQELIDKFARYLDNHGVSDAAQHAKEMWRIVRLS